jgi:hypothetical protein
LKRHARRKPHLSRDFWKAAVYGLLLGFIPMGYSLAPILDLSRGPASQMSSFVRSQLDLTDPQVAALAATPELAQEALAAKPTLGAPAAQAAASDLNLAAFFAGYRTPLAATGQITNWVAPGFQANWGPGMELPGSFNYLMTHDLAHISPEFVVPAGFAAPFSRAGALY